MPVETVKKSKRKYGKFFHFMYLVQATIFLSCALLRVNMRV